MSEKEDTERAHTYTYASQNHMTMQTSVRSCINYIIIIIIFVCVCVSTHLVEKAPAIEHGHRDRQMLLDHLWTIE